MVGACEDATRVGGLVLRSERGELSSDEANSWKHRRFESETK
jgi:hypothetical protein